MALLAAYMHAHGKRQTLPDYLDSHISGSLGQPMRPDPKDVAGFRDYFARYRGGLAIEAEAVKT
jgi:hypothetical protein